MTDVHKKHIRSYNMSMIKGKNTTPEILVRKYLHSNGLRYSLYNKNLPGKPDLCFKKYQMVVFINGCFWHGHENCRYYTIPKTRTEWWQNKIGNTKKRDRTNYNNLLEDGWRIITVWECELKKNPEERLKKLLDEIQNNK